MPHNVGFIEDLIIKNIPAMIRHSFAAFNVSRRFLTCALKFVGTSFTGKRKVQRSANVRKTS